MLTDYKIILAKTPSTKQLIKYSRYSLFNNSYKITTRNIENTEASYDFSGKIHFQVIDVTESLM